MNGPIIFEYFRGFGAAHADFSSVHPAWRTSWPARLWSRIVRAYRTRRSRAALEALDDRMLRDIGVSRHEIEGLAGDGTSRERRRLQSLASCRQQPSRRSPSTDGGTAHPSSRSHTKNDEEAASTPIDLASIRAKSRRGPVSEFAAEPANAPHVADPDYLRDWYENSRGCVIHPFT
jgi:uncharacterized protein YjiS (DUF1127 family)